MKVQQEIVPALASGQVDVASGLMSAGILNTIAKGGKIQIVADKGFIDPEGCDNHALVARRGLIESGVRENPEQLRGATFAVVRATWVDYYAEKALNQAGLKVEDMQLTDIPSASQPEALDQGQIDLVSQNEPWVTRLKQGGHEPILTPAHELLPSANSAVTLYGPTLLNGDPDVGNRFMVAYLKAVRQYNEGKTDRNVEILAKYIQLDPALIREMCWPGLRDDGQLNVQSALDFQQWALDKKFMETAVSEEQFWNGSFVDYANAQLGAAQQ
jgi:NitT/TauT family transport system substrate-binding protein